MPLGQSAVGQAFSPSLAGRTRSGINLVGLSGMSCLQWGMGLAIDGLSMLGFKIEAAFQSRFGGFAACCLVAYAWHLGTRPRAFA